jgi:hypothetical protein
LLPASYLAVRNDEVRWFFVIVNPACRHCEWSEAIQYMTWIASSYLLANIG